MSESIKFKFEGDSSDVLMVLDLLAEEEIEYERADARGRSGLTGAEILLFIAIVSFSAVAVERVANVAYRLYQRFRPFTIVDMTGADPVVHVISDAPGMRGKVMVRDSDGETTRDLTEDAASDLGSIVKAALEANKQ